MKAIDFQKQLSELVRELDMAIHTAAYWLRSKGKGYSDKNDAFGSVGIIEFDENERFQLTHGKIIRGIAIAGAIGNGGLYLYIQDTTDSSGNGDPLNGADYLHPFDETKELTPHMLTKVLAVLEQM